MPVLADLQETLATAVEANGLPGAAVAVLRDGEVIEAAAGVLNVRTRVEATTDSLFQIGSITKVYTATLVMQLVDAGLVDLDSPARRYVPDFRVADAAATDAITVRHLLTHTSGFDGGDYFFDGGRGDDTLERYVAALADLTQITPPGAMWSYNNAGFSVLGHLVELVTGQVWDDALRTRLLEPAGLTHSMTLPEDVLRFRAAAGHKLGDDGAPELVSGSLSRSAGPAGLVCASAADVVAFARLHLEDGRGVLSPAGVKAMQQEQATMYGATDTAFGLGWLLRDVEGTGDRVRTIGHNGGTLGQLAFLTAFPEQGVAIALLTNGPTGAAVWQEVAEHVTAELGLPSLKPVLPTPPAAPPALDLSKYVGRYERRAVHTTLAVEDDHLTMSMDYVGIEYDLKPPPPMALTPIDAETFVVLGPDGSPVMSIQLLDVDRDGRPQLLFAARLARRAT